MPKTPIMIPMVAAVISAFSVPITAKRMIRVVFFHYRFQVIRKLFFYIYNQIQFVQLFLIEEARWRQASRRVRYCSSGRQCSRGCYPVRQRCSPNGRDHKPNSMRGCTYLKAFIRKQTAPLPSLA